jgi:hypothetical protein
VIAPTKVPKENAEVKAQPEISVICMDVDAFTKPRSLPRLKFDLDEDLAQLDVPDLDGQVSNHSISKLDKDSIGIVTCRDIPKWAQHELERQANGAAEQDAASICIKRSLDRMQVLDEKVLWQELRGVANGKGQCWQGFASLHTSFCDHVSDWNFRLDTDNGDTYKRNFRMPKSLHSSLCKVAKDLGIPSHHFVQILLIDGLRSQANTVHGELMDKQVDAFYAKLRERIFVAVGYLRAFERAYGLVLCDDLQGVIERIESEL